MNTPKPTRRTSAALAVTADDISPAGQGAAQIAATPDKMVRVSIARDFTLTTDDHKPVHYKAGIDEMPLSHAQHWFAINAGGVKLYTQRRAAAEDAMRDETAPGEFAMPPAGDPDKMPKEAPDLRIGVDAQAQTQQGLH